MPVLLRKLLGLLLLLAVLGILSGQALLVSCSSPVDESDSPPTITTPPPR